MDEKIEKLIRDVKTGVLDAVTFCDKVTNFYEEKEKQEKQQAAIDALNDVSKTFCQVVSDKNTQYILKKIVSDTIRELRQK